MDLLYILLALSLAGLFLSGRSFVKLFRRQGNGMAPVFATLIIAGSLWLLGFVAKEWDAYRAEEKLIADFCRSRPNFKVYITPEELRHITDNSLSKYKSYRYEKLNSDGTKIKFNNIVYEASESKFIKKNILVFTNYRHSQHSAFNMNIYVDYKTELVVAEDNKASTSANYGTSSLGLKSWLNSIKGCSPDMQDWLPFLDKYFLIYEENSK